MQKKDFSILLSINDAIATLRDEKLLFYEIFRNLKQLLNIEIGGIALFNNALNQFGVLFVRVKDIAGLPDAQMWFSKYDIDNIPLFFCHNTDEISEIPPDVLYSLRPLRKDQPPLKTILERESELTIHLIPMKLSGKRVGFLILNIDAGEVKNVNIDVISKASNMFAMAIENLRTFADLKRREQTNNMQLELLFSIVGEYERNHLFIKLVEELDKLIPYDYITIHANAFDPAILEKQFTNTFCAVKEGGSFREFKNDFLVSSIETVKSDKSILRGKTYFEFMEANLQELALKAPFFKAIITNYEINSVVVFQYHFPDLGEFLLILGRKKRSPLVSEIYNIDLLFNQNLDSFFTSTEIEFGLEALSNIGLILANLYAFEEIKELNKRLKQEKGYLLEEINLTYSFKEVIGESEEIKHTLNKVKQVAPLDATVLIQGETGTGKELVARALHDLSLRSENVFITVNCAALPAQLIESELFGHEKGSFTGASERRIGKFEMAQGGTLFLDEVGELPPELQAKILRVLQEKKFERLGGSREISLDVRIIAATNRNLEVEVEKGNFRADLYFRLNVFPVTVPPLRKRKEDIPLLVKYFIEKYSKRVGKEIKSIRKIDMENLLQYQWPGNIRELEHLIERAIIISNGVNLNLQALNSGNLTKPEISPDKLKPLVEMEKEHIIRALKITGGKITGENSASRLLGINGKTLGSKMRKLGIKREIIITTA